MKNYKIAANQGQDIILTYLKKRMKEKKISQKKLAEILDISVTSLWRIFKGESSMDLVIYLQICGALQLRPYIIPAEDDNTEMQRLFFN